MLDSETKKFVNEMVIGGSDELRAILTDFCCGLREMQESLSESLSEISEELNYIGDKVHRICLKMEGKSE
jgi:hypothetical protein